MNSGGLPHSGIPGYVCSTTNRGLSQSCHALLRPVMPRHPPRALCSLTYNKARALRGASPPRHARSGRTQRCSVGKVLPDGPSRPSGSIAGPGRSHQWAVGVGVSALTQCIGLMSQADGQKVHQYAVGVIRLREPSLAYAFPTSHPKVYLGRSTVTSPQRWWLVEPRRLELLTSALQRRRSPN